MNNQQVTTTDPMGAIEAALVGGDLSKLTTGERVRYYHEVCVSLGLNPLTKPFSYITLNGKLVLYALKDCTEQLRKLNGVSIISLEDTVAEGVYVVKAHARDKNGREDMATGAVAIESLKGEAKANAMMKAETKAKRRVTLSICGMGMLDESEVETIPNAVVVPAELPTAKLEAVTEGTTQPPTGQPPLVVVAPRIVDADGWRQFVREHGFSRDDIEGVLGTVSVLPWTKEHGKTLDDAAQKMIDWAAKPQTAAAG